MKDTAMIVVNAVGLLLQLGYTVMFYFYATHKVQCDKTHSLSSFVYSSSFMVFFY